jgi:uncharacterized protein
LARPQRTRKIRSCSPRYRAFKPTGVPARELENIILTLDELEAVCLTDHDGLYQEDAARIMEVSRQTYGNILTSARKKIASMLIDGCAVIIEGGNVCCCADGVHHESCCRHHRLSDSEEQSGS